MDIFASHPSGYSDWFKGEHVTCPEPMKHNKTLLGILGKRFLLLISDLECKRVLLMKRKKNLSKNGFNVKESTAKNQKETRS